MTTTITTYQRTSHQSENVVGVGVGPRGTRILREIETPRIRTGTETEIIRTETEIIKIGRRIRGIKGRTLPLRLLL